MIAALIYLVIYIVILGVVISLLLYIVDLALPEPFHRVARIAILVIGALILILMLLQFAGVDGGMPRLR